MSRTSPIVLRSGYIFNNWKSHWFSDKNYTQLLTEDLKIRYYINNVYYYLKLPTSDLKIKRRQNRINIMYQNLFLPEFIRADKLNPYRFKFFRFITSGYRYFLNMYPFFGTTIFKYYSPIFYLIFYNFKINVMTHSSFSCRTYKYYALSILHRNNNLRTHKFIVDTLIRYYMFHNFGFLVKSKMYLNSFCNSSAFIKTLNFKSNLLDKFFNKKMNMVYLFKRINTEDILYHVKNGTSIIRKFKRKFHTTNSLLMLDSFGKKFKYNPQISRKKFPFYDFIFFYKVNFLHIMKIYSGYKFFHKNKKKRRRTIKIIKYKYFARYINKILEKLSKLKNNLALITHTSNKFKYLIKDPKILLNTFYNKNYLNYNNSNNYNPSSPLEDILVNKLTTPKNISSLVNKLMKARGLQMKLYKSFRNKKTKVSNHRKNTLLNRVRNTKIGLYKFYKKIKLHPYRGKNTLYYYNHKIKLKKSNEFRKILSFILLFNKSAGKINYNYIHQYLSKYNFYQSMVVKILYLKRRIYELINYNWTSLKRLLKSALVKFRYKIIKKKSKFHRRFKKKQYSSNIFSISFLNFQLEKNYFNYKHIHKCSLHPLYNWVYDLLKLNCSFSNKFNTLNRFFFRRRLSLIKLSKASRYFVKLRKYKKKKVDKFDIRYLPPFWRNPWGKKNKKKTNLKNNYSQNQSFNTVEDKYKEVSSIMNKPRFKQKSLLKKPFKNYIKNRNSLKLKKNLLNKLKRNLIIDLKPRHKNKKYRDLIDGKVFLSEYGPPFSSDKQSYIKRKKKIFYKFLISFFVYVIKIFKNKKMSRKTSSRVRKLIVNLRKNSRRKFFYKERKIKRLSYIRYYIYIMKHYYPIIFGFFKRLFRFKTRNAKNKIIRNPKAFYNIKKKKLPVPFKYKNFIKFVNKYNSHKKFFKNRRFLKKNKYGWSSGKRKRSSKLDKSFFNDKALDMKKHMIKSIYSKYKVHLKTFKQKMLELRIFKDDSRLIYMNQEFELVLKAIKILRNVQSKLFSNRFKFLHNRVKNKYNYSLKSRKSTKISKFHKSDNKYNNYRNRGKKNLYNSKRKISYNNDRLIKVIINNSFKLNISFLTKINKFHRCTNKVSFNKKKLIYIYIVFLKKMIHSFINYKFHRLYTTVDNNNNFNWDKIALRNKSNLYKSYFNHKSRIAMKLIRITNHHKLTLKYLKLNKNSLFYNMSFLKKFLEKIIKHSSYMLLNSYNNNKMIRTTPYWVNNRSHKKYYLKMYIRVLKFFNFGRRNHMFIKTLNQRIKLKKKIKKSNKIHLIRSLSKKSGQNREKIIHSFSKLLTRRFVKRNNKVIYNNSFLSRKYKMIFRSIINASLYFFFRKNIFLRSKKSYALRRTLKNPILYKNLFPTSSSIINVRKAYKNKLNKPKYLNYHHKNLPKESNIYLLNNNNIFRVNKEIINFIKYFNIIISISNKLINNYYIKMSCFLKKEKAFSLYENDYKFINQNYLMIVNFLKNLINSMFEFITNNFIVNLITYIKHNLLSTSYYISRNFIRDYDYNWLKFSYFNMKYQLMSKNLKDLLTFKLLGNMNKDVQTSSNLKSGNTLKTKENITSNDNGPIRGIINVSEYLTKDTMNYLQLNYMMEYDTNNLVQSEENFLYFYNVYQYDYDYNSLFVLNPRLLCDYFIFAVKNKVQYYEIFSDVRQATGDLFRLRNNLKKLYDRILYTFLHRYLDYIIDSYYLKLKVIKNDDKALLSNEYIIFLKKSRVLTKLFAYVTYLIEIRNYTNIKGIHIKTGGRRSRKLRTHTRLYQRGPMSLNTFSDEIDYYFKPIISRFGTLGLKIYLYRESCHRIPLYQVMYEVLFLRFKTIRNMILNNNNNNLNA